MHILHMSICAITESTPNYLCWVEEEIYTLCCDICVESLIDFILTEHEEFMLFTFFYGGRGTLNNYLVKKSPPSQVKVYYLPNSLFHRTFLDLWKIYINIPLFGQIVSTFVGHLVDILIFYSNQKGEVTPTHWLEKIL